MGDKSIACRPNVVRYLKRVDTQGSAVLHVIAGRPLDHSPLLGELAVQSRDFH